MSEFGRLVPRILRVAKIYMGQNRSKRQSLKPDPPDARGLRAANARKRRDRLPRYRMPYTATVLPVMIASPADVHEYRAAARDVIHEWNTIHSVSHSTVLMPVGWETHSSPELGASAQDLINDRVLEECDLLVGIFWTRLGSPTTRAPSGTVEEIQRHVAAGKPAMVYFSQQPAALETLDATQYAALKEFRGWCESQGIIERFFGAEEFRTKLRRHLQIAIQKNDYLHGIILAAQATTALETTPSGPSLAIAGLSPEAKQLLVTAAADESGVILTMNVMAGRIVQAGGTVLGDVEDRREMEKWYSGLEQLEILSLVRRESESAYAVTDLGYRAADEIRASMPPGA